MAFMLFGFGTNAFLPERLSPLRQWLGSVVVDVVGSNVVVTVLVTMPAVVATGIIGIVVVDVVDATVVVTVLVIWLSVVATGIVGRVVVDVVGATVVIALVIMLEVVTTGIVVNVVATCLVETVAIEVFGLVVGMIEVGSMVLEPINPAV